jgi:hypothetical protein
MSQYRCIYCGVSIPPDVGLSCAACSKKGSNYKNYDKEFAYADEIEPQVSQILSEAEIRDESQSSTQAKEEFQRLFEANVESRKPYRFPDQEELKTKREGKILHMNEFLRLLRAALPAGYTAWFTEKGGMRGTLGLYVGHPVGSTLPETCTHEFGQPHYVGFVQVPYMQEFEELHFDRYNVPLGSKRRGWRTIGLKLIEQKILSEQDFHQAFGEPPTGEVSRRYRAYLQFLRSR